MKELLKSKGLKLTKQREFILELINKLQDQATSTNLTKFGSDIADKSTIYRIIELFIENDILIKEINYNNEIYYRIKEEHGHYFTCIKCHRKERIDDCPIEEIELLLKNNKGYKVLNHTVEINGICNECLLKN